MLACVKCFEALWRCLIAVVLFCSAGNPDLHLFSFRDPYRLHRHPLRMLVSPAGISSAGDAQMRAALPTQYVQYNVRQTGCVDR